jgi:hypothetical protein
MEFVAMSPSAALFWLLWEIPWHQKVEKWKSEKVEFFVTYYPEILRANLPQKKKLEGKKF